MIPSTPHSRWNSNALSIVPIPTLRLFRKDVLLPRVPPDRRCGRGWKRTLSWTSRRRSGDPAERRYRREAFRFKKNFIKKREFLYKAIFAEAQGVGIGIVGQEEIDHFNILQATLKAMALALADLPFSPDFILIDGPHGLPIAIHQKPIPKGDTLCNSIAAASIIAKVTRDRMMMECHQRYPQYNFAKHKGYGTKEHREAIEKFGICELHRKSFKGVKEYLSK